MSDLDIIRLNQHANYLGHRSFCSEFIVATDTNTGLTALPGLHVNRSCYLLTQ